MDDTLEFLTKIYSELTEFKKDMTEFRKETKEDIQGLKKDVLRMEQDHGKKLQALFDGHIQHDRKLDSIEEKVSSLVEDVEKHDMKITAIQGGRK